MIGSNPETVTLPERGLADARDSDPKTGNAETGQKFNAKVSNFLSVG